MKLTHIELDLAAAYVQGELSGKTLTDFEAALSTNEALREEVMFQKSIGTALRLNVAKTTMKQAKIDNLFEDKTRHPQLNVIENTMQQARIDNANRQKRIRRWWIGLAAACLLGIGFFGDDLISRYQTNNMIASWPVQFEDPNSGFEEVSGPTDTKTHIKNAQEQYDKRELEAALSTLNMIPKSKLPDYILLAKGQIHAQLKNYPKSKQLLSLATQSNKTNIQDNARLALGMVHLRLREKEAAKKQFEQISTESIKEETKLMMKEYLWFYPNFE